MNGIWREPLAKQMLKRMATELAASAVALTVLAAFWYPFRGFAVVAAVKLLLRKGRRGIPDALALLALPATFGCLAAAQGIYGVLKIAAPFRAPSGGTRALSRIARAACTVWDLDTAIARLPGSFLRPRSSRLSVWIPLHLPKAAGEAAKLASAVRRWLLIAALASVLIVFTGPMSLRVLATRAAVALWLLGSRGT